MGGELLTINTAERVGGGGGGGAGGGVRDRVDRVMNPLPSTEMAPSGYLASESGRGGTPVSTKVREVALKAQQVSAWACACMCMCVWACACMCLYGRVHACVCVYGRVHACVCVHGRVHACVCGTRKGGQDL